MCHMPHKPERTAARTLKATREELSNSEASKELLSTQLKATHVELSKTKESEDNLNMMCWAKGGLEDHRRIMKQVRQNTKIF